MSILRHELNGVEFFTVQTTGESGMSQSGLARLCGVTQKAVDNLLERLGTSSCPDFLQPLQDKELTLGTSYHEYHNVTIIKDSVCAIILEWYAFESQRPTEKAKQAFRQFAAMGIRTWIQSITGWENSLTATMALDSQVSIAEETEIPALNDADIAPLLKQIDSLKQDLNLALKHRHIIHNVVEKPVAVDLSLNRIVHTAIHEQAIKLNRAIATLETIERGVAVFSGSIAQVKQNELCSTLHQMIDLVEQLRQENSNQKQVIDRQQILITSSRKNIQQISQPESQELRQALQPRIKEITAILMKSQKRTGGNRAIDTCTRRARIYARYEIGQSLEQIARALKIPYETVKSYIKLTKAEIKNYYFG